MTTAPNNYEISIIDTLVVDFNALTSGATGSDTKLFPGGVVVVPESHIETWLSELDSARSPWGAILWDEGEDEPGGDGGGDEGGGPPSVDRVQIEQMTFGFVVATLATKTSRGNYRDAIETATDAFNRMKNEIRTTASALFAADTIAPTLEADYLEWSERLERPEDIGDDYLLRGQWFKLGIHYGGSTRIR